MPLSIVVSNLIRFGIQFMLFFIFWGWYLFKGLVHPNIYLLLTPYFVFLMAIIGLGAGMLISALTTKYRDLSFLVTFGIQLLMYSTPIIYPMSALPQKFAFIIRGNPLSAVVESFRFAFTGSGEFSWQYLGYSTFSAFALLAIGTIVFNKVEKTFMDTV
jgi:lipopolysaccharide transport system permease protein